MKDESGVDSSVNARIALMQISAGRTAIMSKRIGKSLAVHGTTLVTEAAWNAELDAKHERAGGMADVPGARRRADPAQ